MFRSIFLLFALAPTALVAALPPCAEDDWMRKATDVVQIEVTGVEVPPGIGEPEKHVNCPVRGVVRRSFRGTLAAGDAVSFSVLCWTDAVGGGRVTNPEALRDARVLEVHLLDGRPVTHGPSVRILQDLTDQVTWKPECG